uniref:Microfibril associated protein 5 n=1 Tax=Otolemur garnettii TaxID=30611 RepID=H0Y0I7_OTOGA
MLLLGPKVLLFLTVLIVPSEWIPLWVNGQRGDDVTQVTQETFTDDPNLVNDPPTDETAFSVLADVEPSIDDLASSNDKNTTTGCWSHILRVASLNPPRLNCIRKTFFLNLRRMYIINNEICSRLVCKEHEAMKDELCRQMAGLPPRRLRRSNYFRLPPCENMDFQRPGGL